MLTCRICTFESLEKQKTDNLKLNVILLIEQIFLLQAITEPHNFVISQ